MSTVWFITGAGSGIGAATARAALKAGNRVVATGRNLTKVRNALNDVASENLALVQLDVASEAQAKPAINEAIRAFGRIDVLVNNAGYSLLGNFEELSTVEIEQLIATNFYGVMHVMRAVLPVMRKQRSGRIINVSSLEVSSASGTARPIAPQNLQSKACRHRWPTRSSRSASGL
jgi:NADP-dependent 3-hydroxy acid dehydrogenase YdfG